MFGAEVAPGTEIVKLCLLARYTRAMLRDDWKFLYVFGSLLTLYDMYLLVLVLPSPLLLMVMFRGVTLVEVSNANSNLSPYDGSTATSLKPSCPMILENTYSPDCLNIG